MYGCINLAPCHINVEMWKGCFLCVSWEAEKFIVLVCVIQVCHKCAQAQLMSPNTLLSYMQRHVPCFKVT